MNKYFVTRSVTVTVTEIVESEMCAEDLKETMDTKVKSLAGEISDLGLAKKYGNVHYSFPDETIVTPIK